MLNIINDKFCSINKYVSKHLEKVVFATMKCASASTYEIVREMCRENGKTFKTNISTIDRLLQNSNMQIDDTWWRNHINLLFELLEEKNIINIKEKIQINIDFTSSEDYFLILSASLIIDDKAITLYFSTRNYPKKKGAISQIKMEKAFIKSLKHLLSKKYKYVIVADRGFGNKRFITLCEENGFDYVIRSIGNFNVINPLDRSKINISELKEEAKFKTEVISWKKEIDFTIKKSECNNLIWYLMTNNKDLNAFEIYSNRFKIEKIYQDFKSSGYRLEQNKIRKYDRFRRLLYIVSLAHCLTCILGYIVKNTTNNIKKNYIEQENQSLKLILAFSKLDLKLCPYIFKNPLSYLKAESIQEEIE